jgi:hypothetical protein
MFTLCNPVMSPVALVVCGGLHPPGWTAQILATIAADERLSQLPVVTFCPSSPLAVLSARSLRQQLDARLVTPNPALIIWAFSAGCVGAAALANHWHRYRNPVLALFLVDGWGVPWSGIAPLHRLSHDRFTHTTSRWLGQGTADFVATPAVPHPRLWQSPQTVLGEPGNFSLGGEFPRGEEPDTVAFPGPGERWEGLSAADFLCGWSRYYLDLRDRNSPIQGDGENQPI